MLNDEKITSRYIPLAHSGQQEVKFNEYVFSPRYKQHMMQKYLCLSGFGKEKMRTRKVLINHPVSVFFCHMGGKWSLIRKRFNLLRARLHHVNITKAKLILLHIK